MSQGSEGVDTFGGWAQQYFAGDPTAIEAANRALAAGMVPEDVASAATTWQAWAKATFPGNENKGRAAASGALVATLAGSSSEQAMIAGRRAAENVTSHRQSHPGRARSKQAPHSSVQGFSSRQSVSPSHVAEGVAEPGWAPNAPAESPKAIPVAKPAAVSTTSVPSAQGGPWTGTVGSVTRRADSVTTGKQSSTTHVLAFRLEQFTERGDRLGVMSVELRGKELIGDVAVGDRVTVHGRARDGIVLAKWVDNQTTGGAAHELAAGKRRLRTLVGAVVVLVIIAAFAVFIRFAILSVNHAQQQFNQQQQTQGNP